MPADYLTTKPYKKYKAIKEIPNVKKGAAAPWFGKPGGAIQIKTSSPFHTMGNQIRVLE